MSGPLYMQIAQHMRDRVASGCIRPGQVLPPERELMTEFDVSRVTVRRALKELVDESLLVSRQGSGYIVQTSSHLHQLLNRITSFSEDCLARGLTPGSVLISRKPGRSNAEESRHFAVQPGSEVLRVKRIRTGNGEPLLLEHASLLASRAPEWPWPHGSLYEGLKQLDLMPERVRQQYVPVLADDTMVKRLEVVPGSPVMLVIRAGFTKHDIPVEYSLCWFRPDRWTFSHDIRR